MRVPAAGVSVEEIEPLTAIEKLPVIERRDDIGIGPNDIDVWCCFYDTVRDVRLFAAYEALMTPDERARYRRLRFAPHRLQFLVTRALCRWVLSRYVRVNPREWRFVRSKQGKPMVAAPAVMPRIWFNLSDTRSLVACAVSRAHDLLGVDVEAGDHRLEPLAIAERYFSRAEIGALNGLPPQRHRERFLSYWTLKESYIKARGLGLSLPLGQISFHLDNGAPITASYDPRLGDDASKWRFALLRASAEHILAIAVKVPTDVPILLRVATCIPLVGIVEATEGVRESNH